MDDIVRLVESGIAHRPMPPRLAELLRTGQFLGAGSEGVAIKVAARGEAPTVVKLITMRPSMTETMDRRSRARVGRELMQLQLVHDLRMPFLPSSYTWFVYDRAMPALRARHLVGPSLRGGIDATDLLGEAVATRARHRMLERLEPETARRLNPADVAGVAQAYAEMRRGQLGEAQTPPVVVIRQEWRGDETFNSLVETQRLYARPTGAWRFVSALMAVVLQMVARLQADYGWIHGDLSTSNVVLRQYAGKHPLPADMHAFQVRGRALAAEDLMFGGSTWVPSFVDLSHAGLDTPGPLPLAKNIMEQLVQPSHRFSATVDVQRLGLWLCQLVAYGVAVGPGRPRHLPVGDICLNFLRLGIWMLEAPQWYVTDVALVWFPTHRTFVRAVAWYLHYAYTLIRASSGTATPDELGFVSLGGTQPGQFALLEKLHDYIGGVLNHSAKLVVERRTDPAAADHRLPSTAPTWDVLACD
jgi:hypothetical protein